MSEPLFTAVSFYSLAGVLGILSVAYTASNRLLRKNASASERAAFVWLVCPLFLVWVRTGYRY